jgi:hypothetical protein
MLAAILHVQLLANQLALDRAIRLHYIIAASEKPRRVFVEEIAFLLSHSSTLFS